MSPFPSVMLLADTLELLCYTFFDTNQLEGEFSEGVTGVVLLLVFAQVMVYDATLSLPAAHFCQKRQASHLTLYVKRFWNNVNHLILLRKKMHAFRHRSWLIF
jgi:hypothetical protein